MLTCTVQRGFPQAELPEPYTLFGEFLTAVASPARLAEFRQVVAAAEVAAARYAHDYTRLILDPGRGTAEVVMDHPLDDASESCVMPLGDFIRVAHEWVAFCELHPVRLPARLE